MKRKSFTEGCLANFQKIFCGLVDTVAKSFNLIIEVFFYSSTSALVYLQVPGWNPNKGNTNPTDEQLALMLQVRIALSNCTLPMLPLSSLYVT